MGDIVQFTQPTRPEENPAIPMRVPAEFDWLPAPTWNPSIHQYHSNRYFWGSTMLKVFRDSPGLAWSQFIKGEIEPKPPSSGMIIGSLVHLLLLEPGSYEHEVVVVEVQSRNTKMFRDKAASNPEKLVVTKPEHLKARAMARQVIYPKTEGARMAHHIFFERPGFVEFSHRWRDLTGVPCKVRFDWLTETNRGPCRINLKTTRASTLEGYKRQAYDLGYHAQEAFYERGFLDMVGGAARPDSLEVVIHNEEPFEVAILEPSSEFLELGRRQITNDLSRLGEALKTSERGCWASDWESGISLLDLPPWARLKSPESVVDTF